MADNFFETLDSRKAYILGSIIFNIKKVSYDTDGQCTKIIVNDHDEIQNEFMEMEDDCIVIKSTTVISNICKELNVANLLDYHNISIKYFVENHSKEEVGEFLKAFYEKNGSISTNGESNECNECNITAYSKDNLETFAEYYKIPYEYTNIFNIHKITYNGVNIIDLMGTVYHTGPTKSIQYHEFFKLLGENPILKFMKIDERAVTPSKANFSDVGYDLTIIGVEKTINSSTILCKTGIKLDIPIGYYVEIVPRSSIIKSGYMLANSIGIIDCSYRGELFVALAKIDKGSADLVFPMKCCQLIMRRQIFPTLLDVTGVTGVKGVTKVDKSKRNEGGFGSSG